MIHHNFEDSAGVNTHHDQPGKGSGWVVLVWSVLISAAVHLWNYITGHSVNFLHNHPPETFKSMSYFLQYQFLIGLADYLIKGVLLLVVIYPVKVLLDWISGKPVEKNRMVKLLKRIFNVSKKTTNRPPSDKRLGR